MDNYVSRCRDNYISMSGNMDILRESIDSPDGSRGKGGGLVLPSFAGYRGMDDL
jgi:hypothetical protein